MFVYCVSPCPYYSWSDISYCQLFRTLKRNGDTSDYFHNVFLTFIGPCIADIFAEYKQDATFLNLFISVRRSTCFRWGFRPSSGAQNLTYSVRYLSDQHLMLHVRFWAPDDGRKPHLKHVERLTEIKKLWNIASCWLYSANSTMYWALCNFLAFL